MGTEGNFPIDGAPIFIDLFKTQAYIKTLASVILTPEQKNEFNIIFLSKLEEVINEFTEDFPNVISDIEEYNKKKRKE